MSRVQPARQIALDVIRAVEHDDAYANLLLPPRIVCARLDPQDARRIRQTAGALGAQRVVDATTGIEDHALQVCHVDLQG